MTGILPHDSRTVQYQRRPGQQTHAGPGGVRLDIRGLSKRYGAREVLRNTQLAIEPGEFVAIVGRSGCGKSTCCA